MRVDPSGRDRSTPRHHRDVVRNLEVFEDGELAESYARVERVDNSDSEFRITVVD